MLEAYKSSLSNQYAAAFRTLNACVDHCPDEAWDAPIGKNPCSQVVFHTLFFADFYLSLNEESFRTQEFHRNNADFFADYEQLQDREPVSTYDREDIRQYLQFCREKAVRAVASETAESLTAGCGFRRRDFSRGELHVYNIRHIQHHAAQISLRFRIEGYEGVPWFGSGWPDES